MHVGFSLDFKYITIGQQMLNFVHQLDVPIHVVPSQVVDDQYVVDERDLSDDLNDDQYDVLHDVVDNEQLRS